MTTAVTTPKGIQAFLLKGRRENFLPTVQKVAMALKEEKANWQSIDGAKPAPFGPSFALIELGGHATQGATEEDILGEPLFEVLRYKDVLALGQELYACLQSRIRYVRKKQKTSTDWDKSFKKLVTTGRMTLRYVMGFEKLVWAAKNCPNTFTPGQLKTMESQLRSINRRHERFEGLFTFEESIQFDD